MKKYKVMVIDDEEDFLKIVKLNLETTDRYEVLTLSTAKDMIIEVHRFRPDVILLDLLMPSIGGIEACEMLNNDSIGKGIPIIVLSALDKDQDRLKAYKVGAVGYLVKPVQAEELIAKIEKVIQHKQL